MTGHLRYHAEHDPAIGCSEPFPWGVVDTLGGERDRLDYLGPCFSAADAAVIAWALSRRTELMRQYLDLRELVDECVSRFTDEEDMA